MPQAFDAQRQRPVAGKIRAAGRALRLGLLRQYDEHALDLGAAADELAPDHGEMLDRPDDLRESARVEQFHWPGPPLCSRRTASANMAAKDRVKTIVSAI